MSLNNANYEHRLKSDGNINPKYVDVLDEDKPVAGQKYACVSFISPEKIIKQRELFEFQTFLKQWDMNKSLEKFNHFMNFISYKYNLKFDDLTTDLKEFCKEEKDKLFLSTLEDEFKTFVDANEEKMHEDFNKQHNFQTSVRGLKIRGSFPSQQEAELRCKMLREVDPNHDVFVGPIGSWMPFHPEAYKTGRVEYLEDELNQLMQEKDKNEKTAKVEFDKRVRESKEHAIEDNKKKAVEHGNVLTQTIDEQGNLVSVKNSNTTENNLTTNENENENSNEINVQEIRKELFEGDNVVIDYKTSDHGLSQLQK
jgi:hypothetical protein